MSNAAQTEKAVRRQPDEEHALGVGGERHELSALADRPSANANSSPSMTQRDPSEPAHFLGGGFHAGDGKDWRTALREDEHALAEFARRFTGRDRWVPWGRSLKNLATSSILNVLLIFIPLAWVAHFLHWNENLTFALCFIAIIPLEKMFDFGGEQMSFYLGKDLGELLIITLNNAVEATLAIILLTKCDLKILQSTVTGVVLLHLLLIPGTAFLTGGARIWEQNLHPHPTQLNHSLLTIGVLAIMLPTAFFASLNRGVAEPSASAAALVSDSTRHQFLGMSRGIAIILLIIYIGSRIYLHNPPGEDNALQVASNAPEEVKKEEQHLRTATPKVNVWTCIAALAITIGVMAATAEFLVESIEHVREEGQNHSIVTQPNAHGRISEPWFGIILLPLVSFAADGAVAVIFFARYALRLFFGTPPPPAELAKGRAIDLSVQFVLFWLPLFVLLGWWTDRPMHMLFDYFELALLLGACFLVNYVTADAKTNWVEGFIMVSFYIMIALVTWYYPGQETIEFMLRCKSVLTAEGNGGAEEGEPSGAGQGGEGGGVHELAARMLVRAAVNAVI